jgi:hypothetical protein
MFWIWIVKTQGRLKLMIELFISEIPITLLARLVTFAGSANLTTSSQSTSITFRLYNLFQNQKSTTC